MRGREGAAGGEKTGRASCTPATRSDNDGEMRSRRCNRCRPHRTPKSDVVVQRLQPHSPHRKERECRDGPSPYGAVKESIHPSVAFAVADKLEPNGKLSVSLEFINLDTFSPLSVVKQIPARAIAGSRASTSGLLAPNPLTTHRRQCRTYAPMQRSFAPCS